MSKNFIIKRISEQKINKKGGYVVKQSSNCNFISTDKPRLCF
jgi:hypothetical protein